MLTNRSVSVFEFIFFRSLFNMCASALIIKLVRVNFFSDITPELRGTVILRSVVGTISFGLFSLTVKYIPLGIFFIIFNACPFFTSMLSYFWTNDRLLPVEILTMVGAFAGIILLGVAKPDDDGPQVDQKESFTDFEKAHGYQIGLVLAVVSCLS